jgi:hypothetical protein
MMPSISDLSESLPSGQTLSTPLLSNLPEHEGDDYCNAEEGRMLNVVVSNEDSRQPSWWNDNFVACWVVLPALRLTQFSPALLFFCMSGTEAAVVIGLSWTVFSYVIMMYVAIATLYHQTITYCKLPCFLPSTHRRSGQY